MEIQAMLIRKYIKFINSWNGNHLSQTKTTPFHIVIIGNSSSSNVKKTYTFLKKEYENQNIRILNRRVSVKQFNDLNSYVKSGIKANIFYLKDIRKSSELAPILKHATKHHILTVTEGKDLCMNKGVHIGFFIREQKVAFVVNKCSVEKSGIKFKYQVYDQAYKVIKNCNE